MKKEYLIGLGVLAVGAFLYFSKKKKSYSDAELDSDIKGFINKTKDYLKSKGKSDDFRVTDYIFPRLKYRFEQAKLKGKDVSKKNVLNILNLLFIYTLEEEGLEKKGTFSTSQKNELLEFMGSDFFEYFKSE
jgi:hypothetical protein